MVDAEQVAATNFDYGQRIEYSILETQRDLAMLDVKNKQAGYYPKLIINWPLRHEWQQPTVWRPNGIAHQRYGHELLRTWLSRTGFLLGLVGLSLQIPIFDGLRKKYEVQQAKLTVETANNGFKILKQSIDLQMRQSNTNLQNALQVLKSQKESLELAQEVARVTNIKFKEGVGSNLEVVTAETELAASPN